ncbi:Dolichyl-diphosphooligosaccharide--protein glycosyltransferase subunit stt3 [Wickerhamiella sorbophila]|uniref:Dolichyl-diphosphooligosaccharide--protein glycosyltransferase subunit STT3 n=1 Tax=Wickerhamiella sorbophila TaxID=45607 RepID=A0A2T0FPV4_9ASCO|nr:Dolichyl-diphosphooligosaccharide--protein glycosyltransferase subunit stt3 [Wickerhamiella sorbophila]PRT57026.1 Dolichyl-diphosphooligosaccharide--protein glycosyltransferase subunit stt3 [Wickerhamiella sorbophila]
MDVQNAQKLLRIAILVLVAGAAVLSRLYSVVNFESIIHEFDPWFNFRATRYLSSHGFDSFLNWFDNRTWYPLGRVTGGTLYPGLMVTSNVVHTMLSKIGIPLDIRNVCVLFAPAFSGLTAYMAYLFGCELKDETAGLLAAIFLGMAPGYTSRSVAGSYDNEAIAITLLMTTFYFWIKALKLGSVSWAAACALSYFYMVSAWGGYVFITNIIPLHVFVLLLMGRFHSRVYVAYCTWYALGTLASMQIPFVGFLPIRSSEHMSALGVFGLLQLVAFADYVRAKVLERQFRLFVVSFVVIVVAIAFAALLGLTWLGVIAPWTGRFYSLWDTEYARIHIPIIASVSEHQPTAWPSFFNDLSFLIWLFPVGIYICIQELRDEHVFLVVYAVLGSYFAGVMVRLMLTLTPIVCVAGGLSISSLLDVYNQWNVPVSKAPAVETNAKVSKKAAKAKEPADAAPEPKEVQGFFASFKSANITSSISKVVVLVTFFGYLAMFVSHSNFVTQSSYSSPSVVLASNMPDGSQFLIDDFREAYYWLRMNTPEDAKVMSWWDYGYQIGGMADRTTLVDNNTWNNTHIATVGKAMACDEETAYPILRQHDVDYILVVFGGLLGFSGDDINKFLWMVRIAEGIWPEEVSEGRYFARGQYRVDSEATETMKNSLMYKMSYYRFPEVNNGADRVRGQRLSPSDAPTLNIVDEAFTSQNWLVRIYKVKDLDNLGRQVPAAAAFDRAH